MKQKTPATPVSSMPTWETLEAFVRSQIQTTMQAVLEEELPVFLGRGKNALLPELLRVSDHREHPDRTIVNAWIGIVNGQIGIVNTRIGVVNG